MNFDDFIDTGYSAEIADAAQQLKDAKASYQSGGLSTTEYNMLCETINTDLVAVINNTYALDAKQSATNALTLLMTIAKAV